MEKIGIVFIFLGFFFWQVLAAGLPEANLKVHPYYGEVGRGITFDASDSLNTRGEKNNLEYRFKFYNEYHWTDYSTQSSITKTFSDTGIFTAQVEVRDRDTGGTQKSSRTYRVVAPWERRAWITVDKTVIREGESVTFEIQFDLPPFERETNTQVRWDYNGDGSWDTGFFSQRITDHIYTEILSGTFHPRAEVIFPNGEHQVIADQDLSIHVSPSFLSSPQLSVAPTFTGQENQAFLLEITNPNLSENVWTEWAFDHGAFEQGPRYLYKTFQSPGTHTIEAKLCYQRSNPICKKSSTSVEVNPAPINFQAEIKISNSGQNTQSAAEPLDIFVGEDVRFSAHILNQSQNLSSPQYRWDFDGDGIYDTGFSSHSSAEHRYQKLGSKTVQVQIQSQDGRIEEDHIKLNIITPPNPEIDLIWEPDDPKVNEYVYFRPKISGTNRNYQVRYDVETDGIWESTLQGVSQLKWKFETSGSYTIKMQVVDEYQNIYNITKTITVGQPLQKSSEARKETESEASPVKKKEESTTSPPVAPQAKVEVSRKYGHTRTIFKFDASKSIGQDLSYFWEYFHLEDDKKIPKGKDYFSTAKNFFKTPGEKLIRLTVEDKKGKRDQIEFSIFVTAYEEVKKEWHKLNQEREKEEYEKKLEECEERRHVFTFFTPKAEPYATLYDCVNISNERVKVYY